MHHRSRCQIRIPRRNRNIAHDRHSFPHVQVRAQRRQVSTNRPPRVDIHLPKHHRNIAPHIPADMNRAEHTRDIARRLPFGNVDIAPKLTRSLSDLANAGTVLQRSTATARSNLRIEDLVEQSTFHSAARPPAGLASTFRCYP